MPGGESTSNDSKKPVDRRLADIEMQRRLLIALLAANNQRLLPIYKQAHNFTGQSPLFPEEVSTFRQEVTTYRQSSAIKRWWLRLTTSISQKERQLFVYDLEQFSQKFKPTQAYFIDTVFTALKRILSHQQMFLSFFKVGFKKKKQAKQQNNTFIKDSRQLFDEVSQQFHYQRWQAKTAQFKRVIADNRAKQVRLLETTGELTSTKEVASFYVSLQIEFQLNEATKRSACSKLITPTKVTEKLEEPLRNYRKHFVVLQQLVPKFQQLHLALNPNSSRQRGKGRVVSGDPVKEAAVALEQAIRELHTPETLALQSPLMQALENMLNTHGGNALVTKTLTTSAALIAKSLILHPNPTVREVAAKINALSVEIKVDDLTETELAFYNKAEKAVDEFADELIKRYLSLVEIVIETANTKLAKKSPAKVQAHLLSLEQFQLLSGWLDSRMSEFNWLHPNLPVNQPAKKQEISTKFYQEFQSWLNDIKQALQPGEFVDVGHGLFHKKEWGYPEKKEEAGTSKFAPLPKLVLQIVTRDSSALLAFRKQALEDQEFNQKVLQARVEKRKLGEDLLKGRKEVAAKDETIAEKDKKIAQLFTEMKKQYFALVKEDLPKAIEKFKGFQELHKKAYAGTEDPEIAAFLREHTQHETNENAASEESTSTANLAPFSSG